MKSFKLTIDDSIESAMSRAIQGVLGELAVQITLKNKNEYRIDIQEDIEITNTQKTLIKNAIITIFNNVGLVATFQGWTE